MNSIQEYEQELLTLVRTDKNNWSKFYLLMTEVEEKELFKESVDASGTPFKSFTAWIKNFAIKNKVHESILWNRKKAGKVYADYQAAQKEKGIEVTAIENTDISMENLVLVDRVKKIAPAMAEDMMDRLSRRDLTRAEARRIEATIKNRARALKEKRDKKAENKEASSKEETVDINIDNIVTASKILEKFQDPKTILGRDIEKKNFVKSESREKYKMFDEFRVWTGTTTKSRRLDALVLENFDIENKMHEINAHGIEIKVSKYDLENDHKYTEYTDFVHYLWLAIPRELVDLAITIIPADYVGIIALEEDGTTTKVKDAPRLNPSRLKDTMTVAAIKML